MCYKDPRARPLLVQVLWLLLIAPGWGLELDYLYFGAWRPIPGLYRTTVDGDEPELLMESNDRSIGEIRYRGGELLVLEWVNNLFTTNLDGGEPDPIASTRAGWHAFDYNDEFIYYTIGSGIRRMRFDGSGREDFLVSGGNSNGVALTDSHVYFADERHQLIFRSALSEDQELEEPEVFLNGLEEPDGLLIHEGYLYWTDPSAGRIQRILIDGGEPMETIYDDPDSDPRVIRTHRGRLYWTEWRRIMTSGIKGENPEIVIETQLFGLHGLLPLSFESSDENLTLKRQVAPIAIPHINLQFEWNARAGVDYQILASKDLKNWNASFEANELFLSRFERLPWIRGQGTPVRPVVNRVKENDELYFRLMEVTPRK